MRPDLLNRQLGDSGIPFPARERSGSVCSALAAFARSDLASNREFYIFKRFPTVGGLHSLARRFHQRSFSEVASETVHGPRAMGVPCGVERRL